MIIFPFLASIYEMMNVLIQCTSNLIIFKANKKFAVSFFTQEIVSKIKRVFYRLRSLYYSIVLNKFPNTF